MGLIPPTFVQHPWLPLVINPRISSQSVLILRRFLQCFTMLFLYSAFVTYDTSWHSRPYTGLTPALNKMLCYPIQSNPVHECRCKFRYLLKFTEASRGFHCDSMAVELNNSTRSPTLGSMWAGALSFLTVELFSKYSNLCEKTYLNFTDGRTDG